MPTRPNPLGLNPLQLKTLTLLQVLARIPGVTREHADGIEILELPTPHGDHFHLGPYVVMAKDATGLHNPSVHLVLDRRELVSILARSIVLTPKGQAYDTGLTDKILHGSDH